MVSTWPFRNLEPRHLVLLTSGRQVNKKLNEKFNEKFN
ncbi:MAG: hypothetical protein ACI9ME_001415, partial [Ilumatobacter sp.]